MPAVEQRKPAFSITNMAEFRFLFSFQALALSHCLSRAWMDTRRSPRSPPSGAPPRRWWRSGSAARTGSGHAPPRWASPSGSPPARAGAAAPPAGRPRPCLLGAAVAAPEAAPHRQSRDGRTRDPVAPPPDTAVAVSLRHAAPSEGQEGAREATLRAGRHAAEAALLAEALRDQRRAHAAEVERLRAEHAAALRRLAEAHWRARDAARTGTERLARGPGEESGPGLQAPFLARSRDRRGWLARIAGKG
jgi:hypothetical protein